MKIAVIGAGGTIGQRIVREALGRGHEVTAVVRDPARYGEANPQVAAVKADARDADGLAAAFAGQDVVVSSFGPSQDGDVQDYLRVAEALIDAVGRTPGQRLLVVGGAGSLEVAPGLKLYDTPQFPEPWRPLAKAHGAGLELYRASNIDWTFLSPAIMIEPGERTGAYRVGGEQVLFDAGGQSWISTEDYAVALLDEIERPQHIRQRFTVAY
ncbi:MAG TPA: NAD(P)-dependent oxidoreductase [Roseiflexaceae bacterium]|nr:NAD(P)-dependent oxidoreductase [Roseiflexaceae bacterium]